MPAGLIFDLDGLLIDSEALQYKAYSRVLNQFDVRVTPDEYAEHWIAAGRGPEYAVRTYALPVTATQLRALKDPIYHDIMRQEIALMPGALAAVTRLRDHFALAVATNSNRTDTTFVLDHLGLRPFFSVVVTRDQYTHAKPAPDAFLAAAAHLGLPARACAVVEDAQKGIIAAHDAGAVPIAVPNSFTQTNDFSLAAVVLRNLDELTVALVSRLLARP